MNKIYNVGEVIYNKTPLHTGQRFSDGEIIIPTASPLHIVESVIDALSLDAVGYYVYAKDNNGNVHKIAIAVDNILSESEVAQLTKSSINEKIIEGLKAATEACHGAAVKGGWWNNLQTGESLVGKRNKGELLMLIVSEVSEAMEGERKNLMDDHLPHRKMAEVELADAIIRICDYAGAHGYDLGGAIVEKMEYNAKRADHKPENRAKAGGKQF